MEEYEISNFAVGSSSLSGDANVFVAQMDRAILWLLIFFSLRKGVSMPSRTWAKEDLEKAVKESKSITEVVLKLGLKYNSSTHRYIRDWVKKYNCDVSHFQTISTLNEEGVSEKWDKLREFVSQSDSLGEVVQKFGLNRCSWTYRKIKELVRKEGIDTSHFTRKRRGDNPRKQPIEFYLVKNSTKIRSTELKRRLIKEGILKEVCGICGRNPIWLGKKLTLHLDHINGDHFDCRKENLRLACPNCHSQTETYAGKKRKSL